MIRKMTVWSAGSKRGIWAWKDIISSIILILIDLAAISFIVFYHTTHKKEASATLSCIVVVVLILFLELYASSVKSSIRQLRTNKLVDLFLIDMKKFCQMGKKLPPNMRLVFSDLDGVLICYENKVEEAGFFVKNIKAYSEIVNIYNKTPEENKNSFIKFKTNEETSE